MARRYGNDSLVVPHSQRSTSTRVEDEMRIA
jgi:hypothetical protein